MLVKFMLLSLILSFNNFKCDFAFLRANLNIIYKVRLDYVSSIFETKNLDIHKFYEKYQISIYDEKVFHKILVKVLII